MGLLGSHQADNAAAAIAAALVLQRDGFPSIDERAITGGIACARVPGRFQVRRPRVNPLGKCAAVALTCVCAKAPLITCAAALHVTFEGSRTAKNNEHALTHCCLLLL